LKDNKIFSLKVSKLAEDKSVFMSVVTKVKFIYGNEFSFSDGKSISNASPMSHIENSMELPRAMPPHPDLEDRIERMLSEG